MLRTLSKGNVFDVPFGGAVFHCRALSGREFRLLETNSQSSGNNAGKLFDTLSKGIRGWSDVKVDDPQSIEDLKAAGAELLELSRDTEGNVVYLVSYNPDLLDLILDITDAGELLGLMAQGNRPSGAEAGKSGSPAPSKPG
mgnify:FL=1